MGILLSYNVSLDKISLHLKDEDNNKIQIIKDQILEYSIQIFASKAQSYL